MPNPTVITDADLTGLLKNFYQQWRMKAQNLVTPFLAQLERAREGGPKNMRWGGNNAYWDVVTGRPAGGTVSPGGFFPPDTFAREVQANTGVARAYVTRQIDGLANVGTKSKEAAFETILRKTMSEIKSASKLLMQGLLHGAGQGVQAVIGTVTDTTHIIVSSPYGVSGAGQGTLLLAVGDYIAVRDTTGATLRGKAQITNISSVSANSANGTLTLGSAIAGMVATDIIVKATTQDDSYTSTPGVNMINGLINITNRGSNYNTLHGINAATAGNQIWDCVKMVAGTDTNDPNQPTEDDIWQLIRRVANWSGHDAADSPNEFLIMMGPNVYQKLSQSFVGQRRFTAAEISKNIKGGYTALEVCGLPCFQDYYVPADTIYLIHLPSLAWVDAKDWSFVEFEGSGQWRWIQGRDAFETTYGSYVNIATLVRNPHGSITGYTVSGPYMTHVAA